VSSEPIEGEEDMLGISPENPWQSARDDFQLNVLPKLERDGKAIGQLARGGDKVAARVIELYSMLHRSFDPMTLELLKDKMRELDRGTQQAGIASAASAS
jgi:hypothetical protein